MRIPVFLLIATALLSLSSLAAGGPSITVKVVDTGMKPLQGVTVYLCLMDQNWRQGDNCGYVFTDHAGRAELTGIDPGIYYLDTDQTGFLSTRIGPLPLTKEDQRFIHVPELVVMLNPLIME